MADKAVKPGSKYSSWTVVKFAYRKNQRSYWLCRCRCGVERNVSGIELRSGGSTGCRFHGRKMHGLRRESKLYFYWWNNRERMGLRWKTSLTKFAIECWSKRPSGKRTRLKLAEYLGPGTKIGPENFRWGAVGVEVEYKGMWKTRRAWARFLGVGRSAFVYRERKLGCPVKVLKHFKVDDVIKANN